MLVIAAKPGYNSRGRPVRDGRGQGEDRAGPAAADSPAGEGSLSSSPRERRRRARHGHRGGTRRPGSLAADPMVQKVLELFEARPVQLDYDDDPDSRLNASRQALETGPLGSVQVTESTSRDPFALGTKKASRVQSTGNACGIDEERRQAARVGCQGDRALSQLEVEGTPAAVR